MEQKHLKRANEIADKYAYLCAVRDGDPFVREQYLHYPERDSHSFPRHFKLSAAAIQAAQTVVIEEITSELSALVSEAAQIGLKLED